MLAFLSVSINSIAAQSTGNVVFAVLYDCKIMMSVDWFSYSFINVDFFFIPPFQISQQSAYWSIWSGMFSPSELLHTQNCLMCLMNMYYISMKTQIFIYVFSHSCKLEREKTIFLKV